MKKPHPPVARQRELKRYKEELKSLLTHLAAVKHEMGETLESVAMEEGDEMNESG